MRKRIYLSLSILLAPCLTQAEPRLNKPANDSTIETTTPALYWNKTPGIDLYLVTVYFDKAGKTPIAKLTVKGTSCSVPEGYLVAGSKYYWRVTPRKKGLLGKPSQLWSFTVAQEEDAPADELPPAASQPVVPAPLPAPAAKAPEHHSNPPRQDLASRKNENRRRREIGGHIFPFTTLFPSPIPSARVGFAQGFGVVGGNRAIMNSDGSIGVNELSYAGLSENLDSGIVIHDKFALDLNGRLEVYGGMAKGDYTSVVVEPNGTLRLGAVVPVWRNDDKGLLISVAPRLYYSKGVTVSAANAVDAFINKLFSSLVDANGYITDPQLAQKYATWYYDKNTLNLFNIIASTQVVNGLANATKSFSGNIVQNTTSVGVAPSIGFAHKLNKYFGEQGMIEYVRYRKRSTTKDTAVSETGSQVNLGFALSIDFRELLNFPLGTSLEYYWEGEKFPVSTYGLGVYYQGIGDTQIGLFGSISKVSIKENGFKADATEKFGMFNITYFF